MARAGLRGAVGGSWDADRERIVIQQRESATQRGGVSWRVLHSFTLFAVLILPLPASSAMPPESLAPICVPLDQVDDRCELSIAYFNNPNGYRGGGTDQAYDSVLSPNGKLLFVTGGTWHDASGSNDAVTVAFRTEDQSKAWVSRYQGSAGDIDLGEHIAISPDGSVVFVAGIQDHAGGFDDGDVLVVAFDATTGSQLWASRYDGGSGLDRATGITVSPDGTRVHVSGATLAADSQPDYLTLSFDATSGERRWVRTYDNQGVKTRWDWAHGISLSPDGHLLYVTGQAGERAGGPEPSTDFVTLAYVAQDDEEPEREGTLVWVATYNGRGNRGSASHDNATVVGLSPDGERLFVAGESACPQGEPCAMSWAVVAYDASSGQELWRRRWMGFPRLRSNTASDLPTGLAVSPDGDRVFVTGWGVSLDGAALFNYDMATVAFDAATGNELWTGRYAVPGFLFTGGEDISVSPDGGKVYVTGASYTNPFVSGASGVTVGGMVYAPGIPAGVGNVVTVGYGVESGSQLWAARLNSSESDADLSNGHAVTVSPDGSRVYTVGNIYPRLRASGPLPTEGANDRDIHVLTYAS